MALYDCIFSKLNKADGLENTNFLTRRSQKILPRLGKDHLFTYVSVK